MNAWDKVIILSSIKLLTSGNNYYKHCSISYCHVYTPLLKLCSKSLKQLIIHYLLLFVIVYTR